jgi:hypothetical protein
MTKDPVNDSPSLNEFSFEGEPPTRCLLFWKTTRGSSYRSNPVCARTKHSADVDLSDDNLGFRICFGKF